MEQNWNKVNNEQKQVYFNLVIQIISGSVYFFNNIPIDIAQL